MSKFWMKAKAFFVRLDTKDARKSVASDLKKASFALFGLALVSVPGSFSAALVAIAAVLGVPPASLKVSTATLVFLLFGAVSLRVVAFLLECDMKNQPEEQQLNKKKRKR